MKSPTPELLKSLKARAALRISIEKLKDEFCKSVGHERRRVDIEIEGLEKRLRQNASFIGSALETEGYPADYELPEDDNDETSLVPA